MDKWVIITKPSLTRRSSEADKTRNSYRYNPYGVTKANEKRFESWKDKKRTEKILAPLRKSEVHKEGGYKPSQTALTKHLLNTLSDEHNPITHSDIPQRSDHVTSAATGHQRSEGRSKRPGHLEGREKKLAEQANEHGKDTKVLEKARIYINGYLRDTTDIEMKRIVALAGGRIMQTATGATHILTSQQLSAAKTHKHLTTRSRYNVHVVRPEWVTDSVAANKRLPERPYSVIVDKTTRTLGNMFTAGHLET